MRRVIQFSTASALLYLAGLSLAGPVPTDGKGEMIQPQQVEEQPRWYVSIGGGTDFTVGDQTLTKALRHDFTVIPIVPTAPIMGTVDLGRDTWDDVFDGRFARLRGEAGFVLTSHLEIFGRFEYEEASGDRTTHSRIIFTAGIPPLNGTAFDTIDRHWSDYTSYTGEVGLRYFIFGPEARIRPFVSLSGGAAWVAGLDNTSDIEFGAGFAFRVYNGPIFEDSTVGIGTGAVGVELNVAKWAAIGVEAAIRYQSDLSGDDSGFNRSQGGIAALIGFSNYSFLDPINDNTASRWSIPVTVYTKIRF